MYSGDDLAVSLPAHILLMGFPGSGKTGALASLANNGLKLRILAFDKISNMAPLIHYTKPENRHLISIVPCEDKLVSNPQYTAPVKAEAFTMAHKMLDRWKYTDKAGNEVDLGRSADWGPDTVLVIDSLTAMGDASLRRAVMLANRTPLNMTDANWGFAMKEQEALIEKIVSSSNSFHTIVTSHLKMVGPKDIRKGDDEITRELKERIVELVPTRYCPSALGQQLPPQIGRHFNTIVLAEIHVQGTKVTRRLVTQPRSEMDLKAPVRDLPPNLTVEGGGLYEIFKAVTTA